MENDNEISKIKHPRQEIREAIANRLKESNTKANENVFINRAKPLFDQDLPAILVYTNSEQIKKERWDTDGFGTLDRELEVFIEAVDTGKENLDNSLDDLALEIETALDGWEIPHKKSAILRFNGTDTDFSIEGKSVYGAIRLAFTISYMTESRQPE